jgi:hypothetical protein
MNVVIVISHTLGQCHDSTFSKAAAREVVRERPCEGGSVRKRSWAREALRGKGPADRSCEDGPREWSARMVRERSPVRNKFCAKEVLRGVRQRRPAKIVQHRDLAEKVQQSTCCRVCVARHVLRQRSWSCEGGAAKETGLEPLYGLRRQTQSCQKGDDEADDN